MCIKRFSLLLGLLLSASAAMAAKPPLAEMAAARAAVDRATAADAEHLAPVEWQFAESKLGLAELALKDKDHALAAKLATEADIDAELAEVRARGAQLRREVDKKTEANQALRAELLDRGAP